MHARLDIVGERLSDAQANAPGLQQDGADRKGCRERESRRERDGAGGREQGFLPGRTGSTGKRRSEREGVGEDERRSNHMPTPKEGVKQGRASPLQGREAREQGGVSKKDAQRAGLIGGGGEEMQQGSERNPVLLPAGL